MIEIWKDVQGYEGLYQVSSLGRIRRDGRILKTAQAKNGYYRVYLSKRNKVKTVYVHRLVAQAFVPNPLGLDSVNHLDENKANNSAENLEWLTRGDNVRYSQCVPVRQFRRDGTLVAEYLSTSAAAEQTGIHRVGICQAAQGKLKSAGGYVWRYTVGDCSQTHFQ